MLYSPPPTLLPTINQKVTTDASFLPPGLVSYRSDKADLANLGLVEGESGGTALGPLHQFMFVEKLYNHKWLSPFLLCMKAIFYVTLNFGKFISIYI